MRYRFQTLSGSMYLIDTNAMTWKRRNRQAGHEHVLGVDENEGKLYDVPEIRIGERACLQIGRGLHNYITTTRVDRIEALDYPDE